MTPRQVAIIGSGPTWRLALDDPRERWSLNDSHALPDFPTVDRWYEIHPLNQLFLHEGPIQVDQVPEGMYLRCAQHFEWLAQRTIPLYLQADHIAQKPDSASWRNVCWFPHAELEDDYGRYFTSTPAWMLAHALWEGVRDIALYGIDVTDDTQYGKERAGLEYLCGGLLGAGARTCTVSGSLRIYESASGRLVLPVLSSLLQAEFQYAFEPAPPRHSWNCDVQQKAVLNFLSKYMVAR